MFEQLIACLRKTTPVEFQDVFTRTVEGETFYLLAVTKGGTSRNIPWMSLVNGQPLISGTINESLYPVIDNEVLINRSTKWLHVNETPKWIELFGEWQIGEMLPAETIVVPREFPVQTPLGDKVIYPHEMAWGGTGGRYKGNVGFWTHANSGGPCGGSGVVGPAATRCCSFFVNKTEASPAGSHVNFNYAKFLYINAPTA